MQSPVNQTVAALAHFRAAETGPFVLRRRIGSTTYKNITGGIICRI